MKKFFAITLVLIMALSLMAGCSKKGSSAYFPNVTMPNLQVGTNPVEGDIPNLETFPEIEAPQFTFPEITMPEYNVPEYTAPEYDQPATEAPSQPIPLPTLPEYDYPSYEEPEVTYPQVEDVAPEANYYLNDNNNTYNENQVCVNPRYVYWDGNTLVAEVFVVNGYGYHVNAIMLDHFELSVDGQLIASANFGELPDVDLPSHYYEIYTLTFGTADIVAPGADLSDLDWYYELRSRGT